MYTSSSNPLKPQRIFKVIKESLRSMPKNSKAVFLMKFILHSYKTNNRDAMLGGLESLFSLSPDLTKLWERSKNSFNPEEGERVELLYKLAIR